MELAALDLPILPGFIIDANIAADLGAHTVKPTVFDCDAWDAK